MVESALASPGEAEHARCSLGLRSQRLFRKGSAEPTQLATQSFPWLGCGAGSRLAWTRVCSRPMAGMSNLDQRKYLFCRDLNSHREWRGESARSARFPPISKTGISFRGS